MRAVDIDNPNDWWNRPCAAAGLKSWRLHGRYGWIMIGAPDTDDAMREAARSIDSPNRKALQVWDEVKGHYVSCWDEARGAYVNT